MDAVKGDTQLLIGIKLSLVAHLLGGREIAMDQPPAAKPVAAQGLCLRCSAGRLTEMLADVALRAVGASVSITSRKMGVRSSPC